MVVLVSADLIPTIPAKSNKTLLFLLFQGMRFHATTGWRSPQVIVTKIRGRISTVRLRITSLVRGGGGDVVLTQTWTRIVMEDRMITKLWVGMISAAVGPPSNGQRCPSWRTKNHEKGKQITNPPSPGLLCTNFARVIRWRKFSIFLFIIIPSWSRVWNIVIKILRFRNADMEILFFILFESN